MKLCLFVVFTATFLCTLVLTTQTIEDGTPNRMAKVLPIFQVVKFPNTGCIVTGGSKNGTCYTAEECSSKGGTNAGSCAQGFGVCCTFTLGCGSTTSENVTYFESLSSVSTGACRAKICKCSSDICQIRLDFLNFVISGPSVNTVTVGELVGGVLGSGGKAVSDATQCLTDTFQVSNQATLPLICGTNTGYHVYFDANEACNSLDFQFGNAARGITAIPTRSFSIRVTQYSCNYNNLAPSGCDQYFFGPTATNQIATFNFAGGRHLANQHQTVCIRREAGNCKICYHAAAADIGLTKDTNIPAGKVKGELCCGYGVDGLQIDNGGAYDCLMIPGAIKAADSAVKPASLCGVKVGLFTASGTTAATVCSKAYPFRVNFHSDSYEMATAAIDEAAGGVGFRITYWQTSC